MKWCGFCVDYVDGTCTEDHPANWSWIMEPDDWYDETPRTAHNEETEDE